MPRPFQKLCIRWEAVRLAISHAVGISIFVAIGDANYFGDDGGDGG